MEPETLTYSIHPSLPIGLSFASASGSITGTASVPLAATTYTVTATDTNGATASANFLLTVNPPVLATVVVAEKTLTQNQPATPFQPVAATGGTGALHYSVTPSLPSGLSISSTSGVVSGTPAAANASTTYTITATDTNGAAKSATFSLSISGAVVASQTIASKALTLNQVAPSFTPVVATAGTGALTYTVTPALPTGLSLSASTGAISGTPTGRHLGHDLHRHRNRQQRRQQLGSLLPQRAIGARAAGTDRSGDRRVHAGPARHGQRRRRSLHRRNDRQPTVGRDRDGQRPGYRLHPTRHRDHHPDRHLHLHHQQRIRNIIPHHGDAHRKPYRHSDLSRHRTTTVETREYAAVRRGCSMRSLPLVSRYLPSVSSLKRNLLVLASTSLVALPVFATNPSSISLAVASPSVSSGTAIVLTATVQANGAPVSPGQVSFCDASALTCTGSGLLGTAQLNPAGTAALPILLGIGDHSVKAVFLGTNGTAPSISASVAVSVTGHASTLTAISSSGTPGSYTLQTIVGYNGTALPGTSETVTFTDTTNANNPIGKAPLTGLTAPVYTFAKVPGAPVATGSLPTRVVTADVTGDGIPDQITANLADGTVSILRGKGDGTFAPISGSPYTVGTAPQAIAVADFNSDGLLDIAVANAGSANVTLLLGNTSGTFTQGATLAAGTGPQSIAAADYNHDGIPDLAVANLLSSNITVLLGDGTGHFTLASGSPIATGANPNWVTQADLNGDGYPDLAFVNTSDNTVGVLLGAGDGTFTAMKGSPFSVPAFPVALTVADLNGDGKLDLAVISGTQNNVRVLLNSGTSFTTGATYTAGASPNSIGVGDFNGDGKPDLVTANANDGTATVLLGAGDGTFSAAPDSPLQTFDGPLGVAVADLDGDGRADLTFADVGTSSVAALTQQVLQTAAATLSPVSIPGGGTHQILAAYSGDSSYNASNSSLIPLTGSLIPTSASLFVSPGATVSYMQPLQLTVSVVPPTNSNYQATGTGAFTDGGRSPRRSDAEQRTGTPQPGDLVRWIPQPRRTLLGRCKLRSKQCFGDNHRGTACRDIHHPDQLRRIAHPGQQRHPDRHHGSTHEWRPHRHAQLLR